MITEAVQQVATKTSSAQLAKFLCTIAAFTQAPAELEVPVAKAVLAVVEGRLLEGATPLSLESGFTPLVTVNHCDAVAVQVGDAEVQKKGCHALGNLLAFNHAALCAHEDALTQLALPIAPQLELDIRALAGVAIRRVR